MQALSAQAVGNNSALPKMAFCQPAIILPTALRSKEKKTFVFIRGIRGFYSFQ